MFEKKQITKIFFKVFRLWVAFGALTGGINSGLHKVHEISSEPPINYKNKLIEMPIRGVYHATRVIAYSGWGTFFGGFIASTAPVSVPMYVYWRSDDF